MMDKVTLYLFLCISCFTWGYIKMPIYKVRPLFSVKKFPLWNFQDFFFHASGWKVYPGFPAATFHTCWNRLGKQHVQTLNPFLGSPVGRSGKSYLPKTKRDTSQEDWLPCAFTYKNHFSAVKNNAKQSEKLAQKTTLMETNANFNCPALEVQQDAGWVPSVGKPAGTGIHELNVGIKSWNRKWRSLPSFSSTKIRKRIFFVRRRASTLQNLRAVNRK